MQFPSFFISSIFNMKCFSGGLFHSLYRREKQTEPEFIVTEIDVAFGNKRSIYQYVMACCLVLALRLL